MALTLGAMLVCFKPPVVSVIMETVWGAVDFGAQRMELESSFCTKCVTLGKGFNASGSQSPHL